MPAKSRASISPSQIRAQLRAFLQDAIRAIDGNRIPSDIDVHDGRKKIKRARANLRLLREPIGEKAYRRENIALRDAARPLSAVRDAKVVAEALAGMVKESNDVAASDVARVRRRLRKTRAAARRRALGAKRRKRLTSILLTVDKRVAGWKLPADGAGLQAGIRRLYRKGRKALDAAASSPTGETLHEARKQTKYLKLALEPFGERSKALMDEVVESAKAIENELGADHDLALLKLKVQPLAKQIDGGKDLVKSIKKRRRKLQTKALKKGKRLYDKKAGKFMNRFEDGLPAAK
jgi:CHAD domain-containing protein